MIQFTCFRQILACSFFFTKRKENTPNHAKKVSMVRLLNSKSVFLVHFFLLWKLLLAAGDNTTEGREFRRVKGSSTTTSTRGRRRLTTACTQDQYLCDWGAGGSAEPKYAVCTVGGESACVDSSVASTGATFDGGKDGTKTVATCGCCGGVDDEFFCDNLPLDQPNCDPATFGGCDIFNSNFVQFCYSDLSKSGKKKSLKKVDCGDPYTLPAYDRGDTFEGCGSTCDGTNAPTTGPTTSLTLSPTAGPTTSPTSSPTDSCLACDGDVKYYFNPLKTSKYNMVISGSFARRTCMSRWINFSHVLVTPNRSKNVQLGRGIVTWPCLMDAH